MSLEQQIATLNANIEKLIAVMSAQVTAGAPATVSPTVDVAPTAASASLTPAAPQAAPAAPAPTPAPAPAPAAPAAETPVPAGVDLATAQAKLGAFMQQAETNKALVITALGESGVTKLSDLDDAGRAALLAKLGVA